MINKSCPVPDCPSCIHCKDRDNHNAPLCCDAFPKGIPFDYLFGPVQVKNLNECNNGYKYEEIKDKPPSEDDCKRVFVINGAPGSGKTRYVKSLITSKDIVLDFDYLTAALSLDEKLYGDRKPQLDAALAAQEAILQVIEKRKGDWNKAFVVTASGDKEKVRKLCQRLNAELITMKATLEECKEHIRNDSRRNGYTDLYLDLADKWFSSM